MKKPQKNTRKRVSHDGEINPGADLGGVVGAGDELEEEALSLHSETQQNTVGIGLAVRSVPLMERNWR